MDLSFLAINKTSYNFAARGQLFTQTGLLYLYIEPHSSPIIALSVLRVNDSIVISFTKTKKSADKKVNKEAIDDKEKANEVEKQKSIDELFEKLAKPQIEQAINKEEKSDIIYNYIYDNVVDYCVEQIENGNYEEAYSRYKSSVLTLEEQFARPALHNRLVKCLILQTNN